MKEIKLTQGKVALVDDCDFEWLNKWKWCYGEGYAVRAFKKADGKWTTVKMHRLILDTPKGKHTDHKDHNGINNQRKNIRICDYAQNQFNQRKKEGLSSKYKGVNFFKRDKRWYAHITTKGKMRHIGSFKTEEEAARAYNGEAEKFYGEFALLNEVE